MPAKKVSAKKSPAKKSPAKKSIAKSAVAKKLVAKKTVAPRTTTVAEQVETALAWLKKKSTKKDLDNLARFGITATNPLGVSIANIQTLGKQLGRSHELALALWDTNVYEARLLTAFVDEPARITPAQMDAWCRDFDNWGIVDTLCFKLWDQLPHAWPMVDKWSTRKPEQEKRAAFALLASLALHDKKATDAQLLHGLTLIERAATDERNFVWKGVSWALRSIGRRAGRVRAASLALAKKLAESEVQASRWIGKEAVRDLSRL